MQCVLSAEHNHRLWKTLHMNENQTHSYLRSSAASGSGLKQCRELILMISGQHPCNNYTSHIRPLFARVPPLNLFACKMRDLNKRSSFINAVIYMYDQCACMVWACHQRVQDQGFGRGLTGLSGLSWVPELGPSTVRQDHIVTGWRGHHCCNIIKYQQ